jgi:hypothetical protein
MRSGNESTESTAQVNDLEEIQVSIRNIILHYPLRLKRYSAKSLENSQIPPYPIRNDASGIYSRKQPGDIKYKALKKWGKKTVFYI